MTSSVEIRIRYAETDQQGVAYHAHYLVWMEIGRTGHLERLGFPYSEMERTGLLFAVSEASCRYRGPARYGETVRVETRVKAVRSRSVVFAYDLFVDERRIAEGETTLHAIDARRRPRRIPAGLAGALEGGPKGGPDG